MRFTLPDIVKISFLRSTLNTMLKKIKCNGVANTSPDLWLANQYALDIISSALNPRSWSITIAALRPGAPETEPPGWVVDPV